VKKEQVAELVLGGVSLLLVLLMCGIVIGAFWHYADGVCALAGVPVVVVAFAVEWAFQTLYPGS